MLAVWLHFQVLQSIFRRRLTMIWTREETAHQEKKLPSSFSVSRECSHHYCDAVVSLFSDVSLFLLKRWQTRALVYPEWTRVALAWYFLVNDKAVNFPTLEDLFQLNTCASIQSIFDVSEILCLASVQRSGWSSQAHSKLFSRPSWVLLAVCSVIALLNEKPSAWSAGQRPEGTQYSTMSKSHLILHNTK